nr:MAG TPA: hypothetical protein [Caudoviricetes sp.]
MRSPYSLAMQTYGMFLDWQVSCVVFIIFVFFKQKEG